MAEETKRVRNWKEDLAIIGRFSWKMLKKGFRLLVHFLIIGLLIAFYIGIMQSAVEAHWIWGLLLSLFLIFVTLLSIGEMRSKEGKTYSTRKALGIFLLIIMVASLAFGTISYLLGSLNLAEYQSSNPLELYYFHGYYLWLFIEMIPALKINDTLGLTAPLLPQGFVAGLPVLAFRIFVIFGFLKTLSDWWRNREKNGQQTNTVHKELVVKEV